MSSKALAYKAINSTKAFRLLLQTAHPFPKAHRSYSTATDRPYLRPTTAQFPSLRQRTMATMAPSNTTAVKLEPDHYLRTSGALDSVWTKAVPYSRFPTFPKLEQDHETDVLIIGSGISGVSIAYELVSQGVKVTMIEARDALSGESGRTSGHLSSDLDDGYTQIGKKHGENGAKFAAASHNWALERVGQVSNELGIDCEYRVLKAYNISQYPRGSQEHDKDVRELVGDMKAAINAGLEAEYLKDHAIKGWDGKVDQRDAIEYSHQATFHPTKYICGVLEWLKSQSSFEAYTRTRATEIEEKGVTVPVVDVHLGPRDVRTSLESGHRITSSHVVEATCVPLQRLSLIAEMEYNRTYCIAIRIPRGMVEDCLLYDSADPYKYVRITACDEADDYLVVGGCDHAVGQADEQDDRYAELEAWTRERFTKAGSVDYKWSGQIFEPVDFMGYIGRNSAAQRVYVVTGDSGNGLTHGVLSGKLISDMITGKPNEWEKLYDPRRRGTSIAKSLPQMLTHDLQVNMQYKRYAQSDIDDVEDLGLEEGAVMNSKTSKPIAVYKDANGNVKRMSALCPHMKGVVFWNDSEKSWDCPVHGSRFAAGGEQICGPANRGMHPEEQKETRTGFME